jgi:hypothetical protein
MPSSAAATVASPSTVPVGGIQCTYFAVARAGENEAASGDDRVHFSAWIISVLTLAHPRWAHPPGEETRVERRKRYSRKFQRMAVERMKTCESVDELAKELGVTRRCLYKWRTKLEAVEPGEEAARPRTHALAHRKEILQLKRMSRREGDGGGFFEGCLAKSRSSTPGQQRLWREGIYDHIRELMPLQGRLSIENMCQLVALSRRGFYRSLRQREPAEEETEVRSLIQQGTSSSLRLSTDHCRTAPPRRASE